MKIPTWTGSCRQEGDTVWLCICSGFLLAITASLSWRGDAGERDAMVTHNLQFHVEEDAHVHWSSRMVQVACQRCFRQSALGHVPAVRVPSMWVCCPKYGSVSFHLITGVKASNTLEGTKHSTIRNASELLFCASAWGGSAESLFANAQEGPCFWWDWEIP